jgi:hypothetical protein
MTHARFAALILTATVVAGCASVRRTTEGWWNDVTGSGSSGRQQGSVYYAASDGLAVRADASGSAAVVGRLALYARVVRTDLKSGWAYVTSDSGLKGWVDNAQLVWRVPAAGGNAPATTAPAAAADTAPPAPAPAPAAAPAPPAAAAPAGDAAPAPVEALPMPEATAAPAPAPAPSPVPAAAPEPTAKPTHPSPAIFDPF